MGSTLYRVTRQSYRFESEKPVLVKTTVLFEGPDREKAQELYDTMKSRDRPPAGRRLGIRTVSESVHGLDTPGEPVFTVVHALEPPSDDELHALANLLLSVVEREEEEANQHKQGRVDTGDAGGDSSAGASTSPAIRGRFRRKHAKGARR